MRVSAVIILWYCRIVELYMINFKVLAFDLLADLKLL